MALDVTLQVLQNKSLVENERKFIEVYLAIFYLRIPEFRNQLIECFSDIKNVKLEEWRGREFELEQDLDEITIKHNKKAYKYFLDLFDWEKCFYFIIKN